MMKLKKLQALIIIFFSVLISNYVHGQINFTSSNLSGLSVANPTSLQFGPDGRLYVAQQDGTIKIFRIQKTAANKYNITATETILLVKRIPNHNDDGTPRTFNMNSNKRQVTGLYVTGTSSNPIIYVASSDNIVGGAGAGDLNLCTNSGILSKLTWNGSNWSKIDLVRGLPRSEENHAPNGIQMDEVNKILYIAVGGFTNAGAPSKLFAYISEYALSGTILSINLNTIEAMPTKDASGTHPYKYDLPTLDDPTRSNNPDGSDINDPWGGNDGLNQTKLVIGGPVQIYASGLRNCYDLVITKTPGKEKIMYFIDNGANQNWGGFPPNEGPQGTATNDYIVGEPGSSTPYGSEGVVNNLDALHKIDMNTYTTRYYAGYPCPIRANPSGAGLYTRTGVLDEGVGVWRTSKTDPTNPLPSDWPPIPLSQAYPLEGDFQNPGETSDAVMTFINSTNGICEYTASNFNSALKGDLFTIDYDGYLIRVRIAANGSILNSMGAKKVNQDPAFASGFGTKGLDVTAQGDNDVFPGTIWVANYSGSTITIFEPTSISCSGNYSTTLDEDNDGYKNSDEIDAGTNPCSAASKPDDFDNDHISDLNDPDDDNDGIADISDPFAIDPMNGTTTNLPISRSLFNNDPGTGFFGLGFTGLMTNKTSNYKNLYNSNNLIAGGAIGALTIVNVSTGDALGNSNNQEYAFQFGINVNSTTGPFTVRTVMLGGFFNGSTPKNFQSQGIYIGNGDQDNYLKVILNANSGNGGIEIVQESQGVATSSQFSIPAIPSSTAELQIKIDPATGKAIIKISIDGASFITLGNPITLTGKVLQTVQGASALAVGIISTARSTSTFNATWDLIEVTKDVISTKGEWDYVISSDGSLPIARNETAFTQCGDKFYLLGSRGVLNVNEYDPSTKTWKTKSKPPFQIHHFQAVSIDNLIYIVSAFTGDYPTETPVSNIYIYDPATDKWIIGPEIPEARRRGSAGTAVYNNKIYIASGIINGHTSGFVKWFDEYDPTTGQWRILPDAPRERDHFHAAINNGKLYLAGGRRSSYATGEVYNLTVPEVDIYNFATNTWTTNSNNLPTMRAGCTAVTLNDEVIVIGGESGSQLAAHNEVEALNVNTGQWRSLDTLNIGRNGTQAFVSNQDIYICSGSRTKGGNSSTILTSTEDFSFQNKSEPIGQPVVRSGIMTNSTFSIGMVANGTNKTDSISILSVDGNQGIMIKEIRMKNNPSNLFSIIPINSTPFFLAPNTINKIAVQFSAINNNPATAILVITHTGKGDSTLITLNANTVQTYSANVNPSSISFSQITINNTSSQQLTIQNTGQANITVSAINIEGINANEFSHNFTSPNIIPAGASQLFNIGFTPTSSGQKSATLKITITELSNPLSVALSGQGMMPNSANISITNPTNGSNFASRENIFIQAIVTTPSSSSPYLKVNCPDTGFRKLKIGNESGLYNPLINVTSGGNNAMEIVFRDPNNNIDWTKIQVRPQGNSTTPILISNYINAAQTLSNGFKKIIIPISNFNSGIDFTQLSNIEFPYSAGSGAFELHIQSIEFTGGSTPYTWFGLGKINNVHDGIGGGGKMTATLISQNTTVSSVSFYQNNQLLYNDTDSPYQYDWSSASVGNYSLTTKATFSDNTTSTSGPIAINVTGTPTNCTASGTLLREYWSSVSGSTITTIPINTNPTSTSQVNIFEGPTNSGANYGARYRGYVCAPTTGSYTFWISSNDYSELWLSTDDNPSNKTKIASIIGYSNSRQWDKYASQKSTSINLVAGQKYYIEALHKQGEGTDNLAVGWTLPNGTQERPIPGNRLSPFTIQSNINPVVSIVSPANNDTYTAPASITIVADATDTDGNITKVEFYQGATKIGEDASSPYSFAWTNVTAGNYVLTAKAYDNAGASSTSNTINITVTGSQNNCTSSGTILREFWNGVAGNTINTIPVNLPPTSTSQLSVFEGPTNSGTNYGARYSGYICIPTSGNYTFWVSGNDDCELWLSTDENASNKVRIAYINGGYSASGQWEKYPSQKSASINLIAGKSYYIEALHKQGVGTDNFAAGWQLPNGTFERPIPGNRLSPNTSIPSLAKVESIKLMLSNEDNTDSINVTMFPNPTQKGYITIAIEGYERTKHKAYINIFDKAGKSIYSDKISCEITCRRTIINIDEKFPPGIYIVNISIDKKIYSERLVVE